MTAWTAPSTDTFHFAVGEQPHAFDECGDWCGRASVGWYNWCAEGAVVDTDRDLDDDPNRFGGPRVP